MKVGVPREVKDHEDRVALTPIGVTELARRGHDVLVETGAGVGSAITDDAFREAGATVLDDPDEVWASADLLLKVKEPVGEEYHRLRREQVLFTYLHLAASKECTTALLDAGATAVAYETVQTADGALPLLAPMSEIAGRMAPQVGAHHLENAQGGRGVLLGGVPGVRPGRVAIIGAGTSGMAATTIAVGLRASVEVLDVDVRALRRVDEVFAGAVRTVLSSAPEVERACREADLVIGAVLVPGARAPVLVSTELVAEMRRGSVLVDLAVDQGGCFADTRPTTHAEPTYRVHDSVFYCVANVPGAVATTSTRALTGVTLPYVLALADRGLAGAAAADPALAKGVNVVDGELVTGAVGAAHELPVRALSAVLPGVEG
ncbi:alanine dehydrogenase [Actinomycetospora cinnamomea]|uniref:Alanine dehydrogenase n=1 Tax=Actinomycetospora cinnamomea TaxID=663609 RepID=A0A2U1EAA3_9PSEU|nr:alanine dehydrogenase [Actinomycetospora cinnamomea]PVY96886.1 L-alanine dehydrogenase [Actinomycetospora cinnamomea]